MVRLLQATSPGRINMHGALSMIKIENIDIVWDPGAHEVVLMLQDMVAKEFAFADYVLADPNWYSIAYRAAMDRTENLRAQIAELMAQHSRPRVTIYHVAAKFGCA